MRLAIDVSHWEDAAYDYKALKAKGIELVCAKATQGNYYKDGKYEYHTREGKAAGFITGAFLFYDPAVDPTKQVDYFLNYISLFPDVDFYCLDVEREWINTLVKTEKNKAGTWKQVRVSGGTLDAGIRAAYTYLKSKGKPVIIYTRQAWVKEYCPLMLTWAKDEPAWFAAYPDDHDRSKMTAEQDIEYLAEIDKLSATWLNTEPFTNVILWQFCQYYKTKGMGNTTDLNMILDDKKYSNWIGKQESNPVSGNNPAIDRLPLFLAKLKELVDCGHNMKRIVIAMEADLHGGNKLGLMNPELLLEDLQETGETRN